MLQWPGTKVQQISEAHIHNRQVVSSGTRCRRSESAGLCRCLTDTLVTLCLGAAGRLNMRLDMFTISACRILPSRFAAQQASLLYMRLGQDLAKPVHGEGDWVFAGYKAQLPGVAD